MFTNMKVGARLMLGFGIVLAMLTLVIAVSLNGMKETHSMLDEIVNIENPLTEEVNVMVDNLREESIHVRSMLLFRTKEQTDAHIKKIQRTRQDYDTAEAKYKAFIAQKGTGGEGATSLSMIEKIRGSVNTARAVVDQVCTVAAAGRYNEAAGMFLGNTRDELRTGISSLEELIVHENKATLLSHEAAETLQAREVGIIWTLGILALLFTVTITILITRSITGPLAVSVGAADRIASKDLNVDLSMHKGRGDEMGTMLQSFSKMSDTLKTQMQEIMEGVNMLSSSSTEILAASTQVAASAAENATAISETTTTVEEVRQAAQLSSQKAKNVSENSQALAKVSQNGLKAVEENSSAMSRIQAQMESIARTIVNLGDQTQSIGGIIAAITDIADQCNLLAVNAGIEAAKAGEQGRGFAVVAQELRSLAEQSKQGTGEVRKILNDVQKATNSAILVTEQGSNTVAAGVRQAALAGEAIKVLAESTTQAVQATIQIAASSQQQGIGMDQIGKAMENVSQATTQNMASMKQTEAAARNINELGQKLKHLVSQYKL